MDSRTETIPDPTTPDVGREQMSKWYQRFLTVGFLGACALAMIGWFTALAWGAISLARWLFF
jgi:hypothetical protein